ncbi:LysM domain-containing protein [Lachnospiraceae bacterium KH1T2]|nr:LysM domain-containing protein [Lachnospiraceae bacterium KH1T2]
MKKRRLFAGIIMAAVLSSTAFVPSFAAEATAEVVSDSGFTYVHDPRVNSKAMKDIIVNPKAVYGYSPDPLSVRLGKFAAYDWSDPAIVEKSKQERVAYHIKNDRLVDVVKAMNAEGKSVEEVAREVSRLRNVIRLEAYEGDQEKLASVLKSNLETYGNEAGPTPEYLYAKYGSWEKVLESAFSANCGMDACLGLYDAMYERNLMTGEISEALPVTYTIEPGDYLAKIAEKYYGSKKYWTKIAEANNVSNPNVVYKGQVVIIPLN